jgi:MYXO-CTERM domain-containing protein
MNTSYIVTIIAALGVPAALATAQTEPIFFTVPASTVGTHMEFANTAGVGANTRFILFGAATHADVPLPPLPPALHTLVIVFEWQLLPGEPHDFDHWGQSPDNITTVIGGMTNTFSTGEFITPGAWDTVAVHFYCGFPITVSATFDHSFTTAPAPGPLALLGIGGFVAARRRR